MVITAEEQYGGGFGQNNQNGKTGAGVLGLEKFLDAISEIVAGKETKLEDLDISKDIEKQLTDILDQVKPYLPYLTALGGWKLFNLVKDDKIKINWEGFAGGAVAFAPIITAVAWYLFSKINNTAEVLSYGIVAGEAFPTIDLNLPQGINLGAFFVVGEVLLQDVVGQLVKGAQDIVQIWPSGILGMSNKELIEKLKEQAREAGYTEEEIEKELGK